MPPCRRASLVRSGSRGFPPGCLEFRGFSSGLSGCRTPFIWVPGVQRSHFSRGYLYPLLPPSTLILLQAFSPTIVDLLDLTISQSLHGFLLVLGGKERGDLDPHFHQSLSPLCEGNPLDLDLGVLGVLFFVLPLIFLHSISCCGGIWERRTWALRVPLPLHLVHRFEFSTVIRGSEV